MFTKDFVRMLPGECVCKPELFCDLRDNPPVGASLTGGW
ncbi:Uncharacterised protein [Kluyvera intermedia]|nr:Uncharacterised protein [Kluyvera intermedia]